LNESSPPSKPATKTPPKFALRSPLARLALAVEMLADVSGGTLKLDESANARAYGATVSARDVALGTEKVTVPVEAQAFMNALGRGVQGTSGVNKARGTHKTTGSKNMTGTKK
jgi:hypothetical protein